MPMTIEEFKVQSDKEEGEILGYGECRRCCFGGPNSIDPWSWPIRKPAAFKALEKASSTSGEHALASKSSKVHCPICGHADDTFLMKLDPTKNQMHRRIMEKRDSGKKSDEIGMLRKQLEEKDKELAAAKLSGGNGTMVATPLGTPVKRGQHGDK